MIVALNKETLFVLARAGLINVVGGQAQAEKSLLKQLSNSALLSTCDCRNLRANPAPATTYSF